MQHVKVKGCICIMTTTCSESTFFYEGGMRGAHACFYGVRVWYGMCLCFYGVCLQEHGCQRVLAHAPSMSWAFSPPACHFFSCSRATPPL